MASEEGSTKPGPKFVLSSKTLGANFIAAPIVYQSAVELFPQIAPWVGAHPQTIILGMALLNLAARQFTAGGLTLKVNKCSNSSQPPSTSQS